MMMRKKTIIMNFHVTLDLGESYLSGTARGNLGDFPVNLQGGAAEIVLPVDLLGSLYSQPSTARLTMNTESGMVVSLDAKLSSGRNIIEIYDDALLEKLAHMANGEMQIEIDAAT